MSAVLCVSRCLACGFGCSFFLSFMLMPGLEARRMLSRFWWMKVVSSWMCGSALLYAWFGSLHSTLSPPPITCLQSVDACCPPCSVSLPSSKARTPANFFLTLDDASLHKSSPFIAIGHHSYNHIYDFMIHAHSVWYWYSILTHGPTRT